MLENKHAAKIQGELEGIDQRLFRAETASVPIGTAVLNLRIDIPDGWIELDGSVNTEVPAELYPKLAEVLKGTSTAASRSENIVLPALATVSGYKWIIKGK